MADTDTDPGPSIASTVTDYGRTGGLASTDTSDAVPSLAEFTRGLPTP